MIVKDPLLGQPPSIYRVVITSNVFPSASHMPARKENLLTFAKKLS